MHKKTLKEKITDLVFWTVIFFIAYLIVAFLLKSSWLKVVQTLPEIYEIIKDGFTITAGILAPVAALILFTDWKEQHTLTLVDSSSRKISEYINDILLLTIQAFYKPPLEYCDKNIRLKEHSTKGSLFDLREMIKFNEKIISQAGVECNGLLFDLLNFRELSLSLENMIMRDKVLEDSLQKLDNRSVLSNESLEYKKLINDIDRTRHSFDEKLKEMGELKEKIETKLLGIQI